MNSSTRIVATLGPATNTADDIRKLAQAGASVFRINTSFADQAAAAQHVVDIHKVGDELGRPLAALLDLCGPKLRLGEFDGVRHVEAGDRIRLCREGAAIMDIGTVDIPGPGALWASSVAKGDRILFADGAVVAKVLDVTAGCVTAMISEGNFDLVSGKGINLPDSELPGAVPTAADQKWIEFAAEHAVDVVAVSFVETASDLHRVRQAMDLSGRQVPLIAKIERPAAIRNLEAILGASDGVMVARGDLGVELPAEQVPALQKQICRRAAAHRIPVICATEMAQSMVHEARLTRAEVSDLANAVLDGADAVMLSAETSVGDHPSLVVEQVRRTIDEAAQFLDPDPATPAGATSSSVLTSSAVSIAEQLEADVIVGITDTGRTGTLLAKHHTTVPLVVFCHSADTWRRTAWAVGQTSILIEREQSTDALLETIRAALLNAGSRAGQLAVVVAGPANRPSATSFVRLLQL